MILSAGLGEKHMVQSYGGPTAVVICFQQSSYGVTNSVQLLCPARLLMQMAGGHMCMPVAPGHSTGTGKVVEEKGVQWWFMGGLGQRPA